MAVNIGPKIGIDGWSEFRSRIQAINASCRSLKTEMELVTESFADNATAQEKFDSVSAVLRKQLDAQNKKIAETEEFLTRAAKEYGEGSREMQSWQAVLNTAKTEQVRLNKALDEAQNELTAAAQGIDAAGDATGDFAKRLAVSNAACKTAAAEMTLVTASYDKNEKSQEKLTATIAALEKQMTAQNEKVRLLQQGVDTAAGRFGEVSGETQKWKQELLAAQAEQVKLNRSLQSAQDALDNWGDELEDVADNLDAAGKGAADFGDILKANLLSDAIMAGMRKLGELISDFSSSMIEQAASLQAQEAQFSQSFGAMEKQARSSLKAVSEEAGIAATRMQGSYTRIFAFAKTAGADSAEALTIAQRAMVVAADSAAYYDRSIEEVTESLQSFLKGNYANDAALGIAATETTRNAKANELYAQSFAKLSESQKVDVLLAMVEAGNKASGAIGQAARESDAWENVTGELNESWRMLQATVGKPVLKNAIPVLQKITASLNDAAESEKFKEFAEGLGNTLGWIVENGGTVVSATASIGAGLLSMKVALNAASYVEEFTGALNAMKLAMAANPWALAIGGATTLIALLATMPRKLSDVQEQAIKSAEEVCALTKATEELKDILSNIDADFSSTRTELESTSQIADRYLLKLEELEKQGIHSKSVQDEYNKTIELLKALLPDVNIQIDEQTGLLQGGTKAIRSNISAWKDMATMQAYQKRMVASTEALIDVQENLAEQQRKMTDLSQQKREVESYMDALRDMYFTGKMSLAEYNAELRNSIDALDGKDGINKQIEMLSSGMAESEAIIESNTKKLDEYAEKAGLASSGTEKLSSAIADADAQSFLSLQKAYNDVKNAAKDSIDSQIGMFDELSMKTDWTFDKILKNLESQNEAFDLYGENLKLAMERGIDKGVIKALSDGSVKSMQILNVLVNGTDGQIRELSEALRLNRSERNGLPKDIADIMLQVDSELQKAAKDWERLGGNLADGLTAGFKRQAQAFLRTVEEAAVSSLKRTKMVTQTRSPSKKFQEIGAFNVDGLILGWQDKRAELLKTIDNVGRDMVAQMGRRAATLSELGGYRISVPAGRYTPGSLRQNTVNLGGISITVTAADTAKIQNPAQFADLVSRKICAEVEGIVAANG